MNTPLLLSYQAEHGTSKIRTLYIDEKLYVSLEDVVSTLVIANNKSEGPKNNLSALIKAQLEVLDSDEYEHFSSPDEASSSPRKEAFITEPGLYRIISRDSTPASKNFQRWIFHEVIPSIRKYGTYPAPLREGSSEIMSLAQTLAQHTNLLIREIEEREKLALETKLRFERNERQLDEINQKIEYINTQPPQDEYIEIHEHCEKYRTQIDQQHLRAMCMKLCLERNIPSKKIYKTDKESWAYPPTLIAEAVELIRR